VKTVYVVHDGATLRREGDRLQVRVRRELRDEIHTAGLRQLVLMGNITLTPAAMALIVQRGIDAVLLGPRGNYRGRIHGTLSSNVTLRLAQYRVLTDGPSALDLARRIVAAKIATGRELLLRHVRRRPELERVRAAARAMRFSAARLDLCTTLDAVRGCEGAASAQYFAVLGDLIVQPGFGFDGRSRRPPLDPVNALLSLGYTLLANAVQAAVEIVGLDPHLGALHAPLAGRPSLVCDLMEEHRAPMVDALVIGAINKGAFTPADFEDAGPGEPVVLRRETTRWLVTLFERRLGRQILYADTGRRRNRPTKGVMHNDGARPTLAA
jgi:CRISPR-associated protein Cas1